MSTKKEFEFKKGDVLLISKKSLLKKTHAPWKLVVYAGIRNGKDRISVLTKKGWVLEYLEKYKNEKYDIFYGESLNKDLTKLNKYKFINYK
jgi:hypothetical protein